MEGARARVANDIGDVDGVVEHDGRVAVRDIETDGDGAEVGAIAVALRAVVPELGHRVGGQHGSAGHVDAGRRHGAEGGDRRGLEGEGALEALLSARAGVHGLGSREGENGARGNELLSGPDVPNLAQVADGLLQVAGRGHITASGRSC